MRDAKVVARPCCRLALLLMLAGASQLCLAAQASKLVAKDGRWALLVDGQPYLMLGGQIHNSSAWPSELPGVWKSVSELHAAGSDRRGLQLAGDLEGS